LQTFNKIDVSRHEFALEWMADFDTFAAGEGGRSGKVLRAVMSCCCHIITDCCLSWPSWATWQCSTVQQLQAQAAWKRCIHADDHSYLFSPAAFLLLHYQQGWPC